MNMFVMCGGEAPVVESVYDCTDHMVETKKEDVEYIIKYFKKMVEKWDQSQIYIDYCFLMEWEIHKKLG